MRKTRETIEKIHSNKSKALAACHLPGGVCRGYYRTAEKAATLCQRGGLDEGRRKGEKRGANQQEQSKGNPSSHERAR